jgi:hypothetical protein
LCGNRKIHGFPYYLESTVFWVPKDPPKNPITINGHSPNKLWLNKFPSYISSQLIIVYYLKTSWLFAIELKKYWKNFLIAQLSTIDIYWMGSRMHHFTFRIFEYLNIDFRNWKNICGILVKISRIVCFLFHCFQILTPIWNIFWATQWVIG